MAPRRGSILSPILRNVRDPLDESLPVVLFQVFQLPYIRPLTNLFGRGIYFYESPCNLWTNAQGKNSLGAMENYLSYLHHTLGLEHVILRPVEKAAVAEEVPGAQKTKAKEPLADDSSAVEIIERELHIDPAVSVHFQVVNSHELSAEEHELFHKIMEALKLPSAAYIMTSGPTEVNPKVARSVIFTDFGDRFGEWIKGHGQTTLRTYSLQAMLLNPDLKKKVWAHLKTLKTD